MPQIAGGDAVDVSQPPFRACAEVQAGQQVEQAAMGAIRDRNGQRLFVESIDIAADDRVQQSTKSALLGVALAHIIQFLLKGAESPQAVVLLRKPRVQVVHGSLFKWEKKLPTSRVEEMPRQMLFLQMSAADFAGVEP
jgi:hypothetical protein